MIRDRTFTFTDGSSTQNWRPYSATRCQVDEDIQPALPEHSSEEVEVHNLKQGSASADVAITYSATMGTHRTSWISVVCDDNAISNLKTQRDSVILAKNTALLITRDRSFRFANGESMGNEKYVLFNCQ